MKKESGAEEVKKDLAKVASKKKAEASMWFFKTEKGQYGAHEKFIGVKVPEQRKIAKHYKDLPLSEVEKLLKDKIHEYRLTALFILVHQMEKGDAKVREKIAACYLKNLKHVNNWDLVDSSAHYILGRYFETRPRKKLYTFARSKDLWTKRVAILTTFWFIKQDDYKDALAIAKILLKDEHDLIHKAVGWMLREVGNRDMKTEEVFLKKHYQVMPRTMLRYAIEKFPEKKRKAYLKGTV